MDFIFNSRQKKVEVFYNSEKEQLALIDFLEKWVTYKEDSTDKSVYINGPSTSDGIRWTNMIGSTDSYTISTTNSPLSITTLNDYDKTEYASVATTLCNNNNSITTGHINTSSDSVKTSTELNRDFDASTIEIPPVWEP